jgi:hypothetical protein
LTHTGDQKDGDRSAYASEAQPCKHHPHDARRYYQAFKALLGRFIDRIGFVNTSYHLQLTAPEALDPIGRCADEFDRILLRSDPQGVKANEDRSRSVLADHGAFEPSPSRKRGQGKRGRDQSIENLLGGLKRFDERFGPGI